MYLGLDPLIRMCFMLSYHRFLKMDTMVASFSVELVCLEFVLPVFAWASATIHYAVLN